MDCLEPKTLIGLLALFWWLASSLTKLLKKLNDQKSGAQTAPLPEPSGEEWEEIPADIGVPLAEEEEVPVDVLAGFRAEWQERRADVERRAADMGSSFVHDRPNRVFLDVLNAHVPEQLRHAQGELKEPSTATVEAGAARVQAAEYLLDVVAYLAEQRRDPALLPKLGDADRLAEACYRPVLTFARSQGLGVSSNTPVTVLADFDLAIWTGLIPTSIAPVFLPRSFFERASWWPAVPHEVGHDFYASMSGLDGSLRAELGLPSERDGRRVIRAVRGGIGVAEIQRVFGAWLEELFCDVFATLMTGPAYVVSMLELFATPHDPAGVITAELGSGGYDIHPPRHLRFLLACDILAKLGFKADVTQLRQEWEAAHGGAENLQEIVLATDDNYVAFPIEPFTRAVFALGERLYRGPIEGLRGRGLSGISGLDYGPHRHNEAKRARAALLAGEIPRVRDVRAVVAGAALAAHADPEAEREILHLARQAIPAVGTREKRVSVYTAAPSRVTGIGPIDTPAIVQALVVSEIMNRPARR